MNINSAKPDSNALVSVDGNVGVILFAMHRNCQLRSVGLILGARFKSSIVDEHIMCIERSLVGWVGRVRRKDQ